MSSNTEDHGEFKIKERKVTKIETVNKMFNVLALGCGEILEILDIATNR